MTKMILSVLVMMVASTSFAGDFKGGIVRMVKDDEGMKVVTRDLKDASITMTLYIPSSSPNYVDLTKSLEAIQNKNSEAIIKTTDDDLAEITSVKEQQK